MRPKPDWFELQKQRAKLEIAKRKVTLKEGKQGASSQRTDGAKQALFLHMEVCKETEFSL